MNMSFLNDRLTRGFFAAMIASVPTIIINFTAYYTIHTSRFSEFASIMIFGHTSKNLLNIIFSMIAVYIFLGILGGFFAYLIKWSTSRNLIFKGFLYGGSLWFFIYSITKLFKTPEIFQIPLKTAFVNFLAATIWGITMAYALRWLDSKTSKEIM